MAENLYKYLKNIRAVALIYTCLFLVLGFSVTKLGLYIDDHVLIFPSLLESYLPHFAGYTYDYGLMRPLALVFYYFIYDFHLISSQLAHIFTFSLHFITGIVLWRILRRGLPSTESVLISLIYIVFPFFTEQYGWYSAAVASASNLILFLQIALIYKPFTLIKKILILIALQTVGVLLYETIFFTFIPVTYLLIRRYSESLKTFEKGLLLFLIALPSLGYYSLRSLVITPHLPSTIRELKLTEIFTGDALEKIILNIQKLFDSLSVLLSPYVLQTFWFNGFIKGWQSIFANPLSMLAVIILVLSIIIVFIKELREPKEASTYSVPPVHFWFLFSLFTILPSFFLKAPSYPFRVLALPTFFLLTGALLLFGKKIKTLIAVYLVIIVFCFGLTLSILDNMKLQEHDDDKMIGDIMNVLEEKISREEEVEVSIINSVHSSRTDIVYGEYLGSCVFNEWCLQAALNRRTGKVSKVSIPQQPEMIYSTDEVLVFQYNPGPVLKFLESEVIEATTSPEEQDSQESLEAAVILVN